MKRIYYNKYNYQINLEKYNLLKKINPDYLATIIDDIFDNGYQQYVRNFIKNESTVDNVVKVNNITENRYSSSTKGQSGENIVNDILLERFQDYNIENTGKIPHSGDFQLTLTNKNRLIIEVKNYNKTVDHNEIDKLKFDMKFNKINYAIFISLNSGIVGRKKFQFESFYHDKNYYYILYVPYGMHKIMPTKKYIIQHNCIEDSLINLSIKLEFCICVLDNLSSTLIKPNLNHIKYYNLDNYIDYLLTELNLFYDEYMLLLQSSLKFDEGIKKLVDNHLQNIKDYETSIKNKINELVKQKCKLKHIEQSNQIKKPDYHLKKLDYYLKKYDNNNWDIICVDIIGKIIKIGNTFDLLMMHNNEIYNEQYDSYEECIIGLNYILNAG
jgi:hypothetical protein